MSFRSRVMGLAALTAATVAAPAMAAEEVNVYTTRQPFLIEPILDAFTEETGIKVNTVFAKKGIVERLEAEGLNTPADVVLTVDIAYLTDLVKTGMTQPVMTDTLAENVPPQYHGENGEWWALTTRARVIYASKDRVEPGAIKTYEDLADPKWKGKICIRPGDNKYNIALIASMIEEHGEDKAREWLKGLKANLARKPQGNDRAQVKAVKEGICDIAIGNTYYMGKMLNDPDQKAWAEAVNIVFPNQDGRGTHMNVSGMVMTKAAPNKENAIKLMEYLTSDSAQQIYAQKNYEYPVKPGVEWSDLVKSWGEFKADDVALDTVAEYRDDALKLVNEVDFNAGP